MSAPAAWISLGRRRRPGHRHLGDVDVAHHRRRRRRPGPDDDVDDARRQDVVHAARRSAGMPTLACSGGLTTTVLPAASAPPTLLLIMASGMLYGTIAAIDAVGLAQRHAERLRDRAARSGRSTPRSVSCALRSHRVFIACRLTYCVIAERVAVVGRLELGELVAVLEEQVGDLLAGTRAGHRAAAPTTPGTPPAPRRPPPRRRPGRCAGSCAHTSPVDGSTVSRPPPDDAGTTSPPIRFRYDVMSAISSSPRRPVQSRHPTAT